MPGSNLKLIHFKHLSRFDPLGHFITTRDGGVSSGAYSSLNLGFNTEDEPGNVLKNREILADSLGLQPIQFVFAGQVHEDKVMIVEHIHAGSGFKDVSTAILGTDAMISGATGICLLIQVADCVPVLFYDPVKRVIGIAHAGWRGTVRRIVPATVEMMVSHYGCDPADILAGIGPSIGPCCYEIGDEVIHRVHSMESNSRNYLIEHGKGSKPHFDLWASNRDQLLESGVRQENIEIMEICTKCNSDTFFSSRAGNGTTGRLGGGLWLKDQ
ncbi:MAG: peptidoglycan editing factor PgeF [Bacteroidetes bacterium]|nr:peptidoglycan editing factor PgeF [Bacteroidota bacterium]